MPEPGDILVSCLAGPPPLYALRVIPRTYQIVFDRLEGARQHAERYARWQGVDVWTSGVPGTDDGCRFTAAARFRPAARSRAEKGDRA